MDERSGPPTPGAAITSRASLATGQAGARRLSGGGLSPLAVLAAVVLLAACGGPATPRSHAASDHATLGSGARGGKAPVGTVQPGGPNRAASGTTPSSATPPGNPLPETTPVGSGGGGTPTSPSSTTGAGSQPGGSSPTATSAAPAPAAPGTYEMRQSGTTTVGTESASVPPNGTLVVKPASADGTQVWDRYVAGGKPPSTTTLQFRPSGPVILATSQASPAGQVTCTFDPPIPAPPWPPEVGDTFSAQGSCGNFSVSVQGRIDGTRTVVLDGVSYVVYVIDSSIATSGKVQATGSETDWYAPALRLDVHQVTTESGTYDFVPFKTTLTSDLVSPRPS